MSVHKSRYDVLIVGAGPAGIFAALEFSRKAPGLSVGLIDKGAALSNRSCPRHEADGRCLNCASCHLLYGWGGAGAFSDGKLTLSPHVGGQLGDYLGAANMVEMIAEVDKTYREMGAPEESFGDDPVKVKKIQRWAGSADLVLIPSRVRHMGTEICREVLENMRQEVADAIDVATGTAVERIIVNNNRVGGVVLTDGTVIEANHVIMAPGRGGAEWFVGELRRLNIPLHNNPVDIGVRVEVPSVYLEPLTDDLYEPKLMFLSKTFDDQVRTFCVCPDGEVVMENYQGIQTVNGHSYADRETDRTNFALLVSKTLTEPFTEPLQYGKNIAALANMLGGGVLVQRLGDLLAGRRSTGRRIERGMLKPTLTAATPGDLSLVLPYRHLTSIIEMLQAMDMICPGVFSQHTLLYGVEVKFYSARPKLDQDLQLPVSNLYAAGDGAGITRGLIQASVSGVHVANAVLKHYSN